MVSSEQSSVSVDIQPPELSAPSSKPEDQPMSLRKRLLAGTAAGLLLIGSTVFIAEISGADNNSSPTEITVTNNAVVAARDFAARPSWTQNFNKRSDGSLNQSYWRYDQGTGGPTNPRWGNNEAEFYTDLPGNVQVKDGFLDITARQQKYGGSEYTSARIKTENQVDVEYGEIEVVAKLPAGVGTWPAIWMLPQKNIYYYRSGKSDPLRYLNPGEIDIMEEIGAQPNIVTSSAQSRRYNQIDNNERIGTDTIPTASTAFHDYGLEWTPNQLVFTVDGKPYHIVNKEPGDTYKAWPYDQPYYLILNDALGGVWGGMDKASYPPNGINNAALPATFQIRSISYSKYVGPGAK